MFCYDFAMFCYDFTATAKFLQSPISPSPHIPPSTHSPYGQIQKQQKPSKTKQKQAKQTKTTKNNQKQSKTYKKTGPLKTVKPI